MSPRRRLWWAAAGLAALVIVVLVVLLVASGSSTSSSSSSSSSASSIGRSRVVQVPSRSLSPYPVVPISPSPLYTTGAPAATTMTGPLVEKSLAAHPAPAGQELGINVNGLFNAGAYTLSEIDEQLRTVQTTGATVARSDAFWEASEPTAPVDGVHHFDWSFDDTIARALAVRGLTWLPIIDYTAAWAQSIPGQDHSPPANDADYATYAQAFAGRYGTNGGFWRSHPRVSPHPVQTLEIWNQPDSGDFWTPSPDAARYTGLYLTARRAIDAVDPTARVIIGGLTTPASFLPAMLHADPGLRDHVDGVGIHPYGTPQKMVSGIRNARATLISLGMGGVPLYVTEFGWTTGPRSAPTYATGKRRADYITFMLGALGHFNCGLAAALLYAWVTPAQDPASIGGGYGISKAGGGVTPATAAFAKGVAAARSPGPRLPVCARTA